MSNFSIDALLGNVNLNQSRKASATNFAVMGSARKDRRQDGSLYEGLVNGHTRKPDGIQEYDDYEELSSDSDVFSEKDYETAKRKCYFLIHIMHVLLT